MRRRQEEREANKRAGEELDRRARELWRPVIEELKLGSAASKRELERIERELLASRANGNQADRLPRHSQSRKRPQGGEDQP